MGLYFRKSKSLGSLRLNFSKSGIGVSTGVKGARLSMGPNGTYINVGRNGIYYRKKIGGSSSKNNNTNKKRAYTPDFNYENNHYFTDAIRVSPSSGNTSELSKNIIKNIKRAKIFTWCWFVFSAILFVAIQWWALIPIFTIRLAFPKIFNAVIKYDLDGNASLEWDKYTEIISMLTSSKKLWIVETAKFNSNTKYNAGASRDISRSAVTVKKIKPKRKTGFRVKTDALSVLVKSRKCSLLFLPSDVIIKKGAKYVAYSYSQLDVYSSTTNFVEIDHVPRDAEIIRYTWQYVNKNGTADKRFNNNRQIPVCKYGLVHFMVGQELSIELHTSNKLMAENFGNAYKLYKSYMNTIDLMALTATEEFEDVIRSKLNDNSINTAKSESNDEFAPVYSANIGLYDEEESSGNIIEEDIYSDLFGTKNTDSNSGNGNSLIDDISMFLEEDENGNV